jgi:ribosomal protein L7/L12
MKNVIHKLLESVDAEQLMQIIEKLARTAPSEVLEAFDDVLGGKTGEGWITISSDVSTAKISDIDYQIVKDNMHNNQKVSAIKHLRESTGWGLREAKEWVEDQFPI